jgi:hypothetical protein
MDNPAVYTLFAGAITTAKTAEAQTAITDLDGMSGLSLLCELLGASGGSTISAWVQTSLDGGTTWLDIALFTFTTSAAKKWCVLQNAAAKAIASYTALAVEGVNDGLLGDRLRVVLTSTGTYTNTTISLRAHVH